MSKGLYIGVGPRPIHPQHILAMEKLAPHLAFSDWDLIDKYVKDPGFLNYDARELPYEDNSIDAVYSSHLLEHLGLKEIHPTLVEWRRVLATGGKLFINVPSLTWAMAEFRFLNNGGEEKDLDSKVFNTDRKLLEVIFGNQDHEGEFHKSGFTMNILYQHLLEAGFAHKNIEMHDEFEAHDMVCILATATK